MLWRVAQSIELTNIFFIVNTKKLKTQCIIWMFKPFLTLQLSIFPASISYDNFDRWKCSNQLNGWYSSRKIASQSIESALPLVCRIPRNGLNYSIFLLLEKKKGIGSSARANLFIEYTWKSPLCWSTWKLDGNPLHRISIINLFDKQ